MQKIAKQAKWRFLGITLLLIGQLLFSRQVANASLGISNASVVYWSNCVKLARQQAPSPPTQVASPLDGCYQSLLAKFGMKLLNDTSSNPTSFFTSLQKMKGGSQQPSIAQLLVQRGYKGDSYIWERQELTYVARSKVDSNAVKGYNPAVDKPLLDQFVKLRLPTLSNQTLDQWLTSAILALQSRSTNRDIWPKYNPLPPLKFATPSGDMVYHGGRVIDGITNIYLIFWIDASLQRPSPTYESLIEQFVNDVSRSPLYANLMQYTDALGQYPRGARLAGTFTDMQSFPQTLVTARSGPSYDPKNTHILTPLVEQEIQKVAVSQSWNIQDYHSLFIILPTMNWHCGWHDSLYDSTKHRAGSPWAVVTYPYYQGKLNCPLLPQLPNHDPAADTAAKVLSHELSEAVSDPYQDGWYSGKSPDDGEMGDKCEGYSVPGGFLDARYLDIDPKTKGNVTWNGHTYAIQPEYDNFRHGCTWGGP